MSKGTGEDWGLMLCVRDLIAGSAGGVAQAYCGQPLDTVKVRLQTNPSVYPRGAIQCATNTLQIEGPRAFYAGAVPMTAACVLENAVLFAGYGQCQAIVRAVSGAKPNGELSELQLGAAGSLSGLLAGLVLCPTELVKCRLQVSALRTGQKACLLETACQLMMEGGVFRGLTYTWIRDVPAYGVNFFAYEGSRRLLLKEGESVDDLSTLRLILAGGLGGASSWLVSYPADVLKSRIQVSCPSKPVPGVISLAQRLLREEGSVVFYRGMFPCVLRGFVGYAALFVTYEWTAKRFDRYTGRI